MKVFNKEYSKKEVKTFLKNALFIIIGSFLVEFGTAVFIVPANICNGGMSGIAVILDNTIPGYQGYVDVTVIILTFFFLIISFLFVGIKFSLSTIICSIFSPLFLVIIYRVPAFHVISDSVLNYGGDIGPLLCALFGGLLVGSGLALSFSFGGSTGGIDVIIMLIKKYFKNASVSITSFALDGSIIFAYAIVLGTVIKEPKYMVLTLINILSALVSALAVEIIYGSRSKNIVCEIVSLKTRAINNYIQKDLKRGSTLIPVKGGWNGKERTLIRVVISNNEYNEFYEKVKSIDPKAFVTFTVTRHVYGFGFRFQDNDLSILDKLKNRKNSKNIEVLQGNESSEN